MRRYCAPHKFNCNMPECIRSVKGYFALHNNFKVNVLCRDIPIGWVVGFPASDQKLSHPARIACAY